jgi:hypothetical protein
MPSLTFDERVRRNAYADLAVCRVLKGEDVIGVDAAIDHKAVPELAKRKYHLSFSTYQLNKAVKRLQIQGLVGFTSRKNSRKGFAVYLTVDAALMSFAEISARYI